MQWQRKWLRRGFLGKARSEARSKSFMDLAALHDEVLTQKDQANTCVATAWLRLSMPVPAWRNPVTTGFLVATLALALSAVAAPIGDPSGFASYGGSASCQSCHPDEYQLWKNSHHGQAERAVDPVRDRAAFDPPQSLRAGSQTTTVCWTNGTAVVTAPGLSHQPEAHTVARVIGNDPLLQYLVPFPGGRWQTLEASYDPHARQWFNSYGDEDRQPGEWGHWTGRGMNWNSMCAACHNTRLQKNYDETNDTFHTTMAEPSVGCEACHGPLQPHNAWQQKFGATGQKDPTLTRPSREQVVDTCGFCHSLRADLTGDFKPGDAFSDDCQLLTVDAGDRYYADGQIRGEDYEYGSFLSSRMHLRGVYCLDCHNPHSAKNLLPGNWLCLRCHATGSQIAPNINPATHSHHLVHGFDTNGAPVKVDLTNYDSKTVRETGGECVNCHMPQTRYMQRHWRHDHGFTSPDPLLTKQFGIPNACNRCHQNQNADWALKYCASWYGDKMERPARRRAQVIARAQRDELPAADDLVALLKQEDSPYWRSVTADLLAPWAADPAVAGVLLRSLQDNNALVRAASARSLETALTAQVPGVAGALQASLGDRARNVRLAAAWSLRETLDESSSASRELQAYLFLNGDEPVGQLNLGNYAFARHDLAGAAVHFQKAVAWDARSAPFHENLAVVLSALNRPQAAVQTLEQAVRWSPDDAEVHYQLGLAYDGVGDLTNTAAQLLAATRLEPRHILAWYNLGLAQNALGKPVEALAALRQAAALAPTDARIPFAAATILARNGQKAEALAALRQVLALEPANEGAIQLLRQWQN
jgi:predicted CXXCH cytochrome family protein